MIHTIKLTALKSDPITLLLMLGAIMACSIAGQAMSIIY